MHVMGTVLFDAPPFEHVVTTGTILNEKGEKLSKSKKNYTDPEVILEKYGADALRFYLMSSVVMKADNLFFTDREVDEIVKKVLNLAWNCAQFYGQYKSSVTKLGVVDDLPSTHILDRWMRARLAVFIEEVTKEMDAYDTVRACRLIRDFIGDLSTWYVRRSRERFKNGGADAEAAMTTLGVVLRELAKVMAPFTPFIAERIYREVGGLLESVHLETWPVAVGVADMPRILEEMKQGREIVSLALERRAVAKIPVRQPLTKLTVSMPGGLSQELLDIIADEVNVKEVSCHPERARGSLLSVALDTTITSELKDEGLAREFMRRVNDLRKKSGLTVGDTVAISVGTDSKNIRRALEVHKEDVLRSTHADQLRFVDGLEGQVEMLDGEEVTIAL
jgi:isoleucyl-tRNA synthetase